MTDQQPQEIDTSRHEDEYQLKQDDTIDIALLANVVGSELTKVDKHAVDNSFKKATKIDKHKIFGSSQLKNTATRTVQNSSTPTLNNPSREPSSSENHVITNNIDRS